MRKEIAWISPVRLGVIYAVVIAAMYFIFGIIFLLVGTLGGMGSMDSSMSGGEAMMMGGGGVIGVIIAIVLGAIVGFIGGAISAFIYNLAARTVGGILIELRDV